MSLKKYPKSFVEEIVVQELKGEMLIYNLKTNKACCLNETSALVWQLCDGTRSISEISRTISQKQNIAFGDDLVWLALDILNEADLLAESGEFVPESPDLSRREMIRKVGLTSMVALPIVTALTAPAAAAASSTCDTTCTAATNRCNGCSCTAGSQCASGNCPPAINRVCVA